MQILMNAFHFYFVHFFTTYPFTREILLQNVIWSYSSYYLTTILPKKQNCPKCCLQVKYYLTFVLGAKLCLSKIGQMHSDGKTFKTDFYFLLCPLPTSFSLFSLTQGFPFFYWAFILVGKISHKNPKISHDYFEGSLNDQWNNILIGIFCQRCIIFLCFSLACSLRSLPSAEVRKLPMTLKMMMTKAAQWTWIK